jgi:Uma2 family endonuclease
MPETRYEVIDGEVRHMAPSDEPHGTRHSKVSALIEAYASPGFNVASDMLTRTSETGDMAPDVSVYPARRDPKTGGRRLEELAFEVVSTERLSGAAEKAAALAGRGVRRIFAIDVKRSRLLEWSRATGAWKMLAPSGVIEDPALVLPLGIDALVGAAQLDDAIALALLAKRVPVLEEKIARTRAEGKAEGKAEAVLRVLSSRGIRVSAAAARRISSTADDRVLDAWLDAASTVGHVAELLATKPPRRRPRRGS